MSVIFACILSWGVLVSLGTVEGFRGAYAANEAYFNIQASALKAGHLSLSDSPKSLALDLAWFDGRVQQLWGLGVPVWILVLSVLSGKDPLFFPSRIAFAVALFITTWLALYFPLMLTRRRLQESAAKSNIVNYLVVLAPTTAILILFPSFCALLKSCFRVYEEACAYAYLYQIVLFLLALRFVQQPGGFRLSLLFALAGAGVLVRPTVPAYGFGAVAVGLFFAFRARLALWKIVVASVVCVAAFSPLLWTNYVRFGSPLEFGHSISVSDHIEYVYPLRFGSPFEAEPLPRALKELAGGLLFDNDFNGGDWSGANVFRWQSPTVRWRQNYLPAIGWPVIAFSASALLICAAMWRRFNETSRRLIMAALLYTGFACFGLIWFYVRCPVMSSRYLYDFAGVIAIAGAMGWWQLSRWLLEKGNVAKVCSAVGGLVIVFYSCYRAQTARCGEQDAVSCSRMGYEDLLRRMRWGGAFPGRSGVQETKGDLPFDGVGWMASGRVRAASIHFVQDPELLELQIAPADGVMTAPVMVHSIRAKIELEELVMTGVRTNSEGQLTVLFTGPQNPKYQCGTQLLFVAWVPVSDQGNETSPWILHRISCRQ